MTDEPIAHTSDGRPLFDNTPTVVAVLVLDKGRLVVVRRNNEPGRGKLGLPGGYHMRGETWQQAGAREVLEETGLIIDPAHLTLVSMETDEYGNNLVIARHSGPVAWSDGELDGEAEETLFLDLNAEPSPDVVGWRADSWAFPRHYEAARQFARSQS